MIIYTKEKKHLVLLPVNISKIKFLQKAKVRKDSYFYKRLESIYIAITASTTDVKEEYKTYYSEYESFYDFLYHKYPDLDEQTIKMILRSIKTNRYILLRGYMYELSDYNLHTLMEYSEEFPKIINNLLKAELYED